jgi:hypothetical protein
MASHGWTIRRGSELVSAGADFDLIAENDTAIVFFASASTQTLPARADNLAGAIGAITLSLDAGVKVWEAYLLLLVEDDVSASRVAQDVQRDLNYCRKIVLDGQAIAGAENPAAAMESALSFLFPLDSARVPTVPDVRAALVDMIVEKGLDRALVTSLVTTFDRESDCKCWDRVKEASLGAAAE